MRKLLALTTLLLLSTGLGSLESTYAYAETRYFAQRAIAEWQGEKFTIQRIEFLDEDSIERQNLEAWLGLNRAEIDELQTALRSSALGRALTEKSVQLNNVVAVTRALNGNLVVYLR